MFAPLLACLFILVSGLLALSGLKSERRLAKAFAITTVILLFMLVALIFFASFSEYEPAA